MSVLSPLAYARSMPQPDVQQRLGRRVRDARQDCQLTQEQLAERCRLTAKSISEIERGRVNVPLMTLASIAEALGLTLSEVTLGIDSPVPRVVHNVGQLLAGRSAQHQARILNAMHELLRT